jgi:hypothetical protein
MKLSRNDPCSCGSGKKYKHCCLGNEGAPVVDLADRIWRQMREAIDGYATAMLRFIEEPYGKDAVPQAWLEFIMGASEKFVPGAPNTELFFSWLFHRWKPDLHKGNHIVDPSLNEVVPTRAYLDRRSALLSPLLHRYLETCLATPFGFHEILNCQPGFGFTTKDVFSGKLLNVRERSASSTLKDGEIIFGLVVPVQSIALVEAAARFSFPPIFKTHLIHVRQRNELQEHPDMALRSLYLSLAQAYLNPKPPELHNTDGDRLEPRTLYFDIDSAQIAFDALVPLAMGTSRDELLEDGKFDRTGSLVEAAIPWIKPAAGNRSGLQTVLMGRIRIADRKLTVEVNSVSRAKAIRATIEQLLGERARYRRSRKQSIESVVPAMTGGPGIRASARSADDEELMQHPEVRAQLAEMQRRHYESWPEIPLPALNGRAPLDAVKDTDGREIVETLLNQFERDDAAMSFPTPPEVFSKLAPIVGLAVGKRSQFDHPMRIYM